VIVCHCQGVCDRSIRRAVREGARSLREIAKACRAGRNCGGCRPVIREIIAEESSEPPPAAFASTQAHARS
jgi:bacterioferritin-associated ferredoxin